MLAAVVICASLFCCIVASIAIVASLNLLLDPAL
jgi:hypothetical protein